MRKDEIVTATFSVRLQRWGHEVDSGFTSGSIADYRSRTPRRTPVEWVRSSTEAPTLSDVLES